MHARTHADRVVIEPGYLGSGGVVLVVDLTHDLLEHVLDGDDSRGAAVLVDDDRHVRASRLHVLEQLIDLLAVRDHEGRSHERLDRLGLLRVAAVEDPSHDVLEINDADDIVGVLADDRDAREARSQAQRECLAQGLVPLDEDHLGARHHDLAREGVAEFEDGVDHLPLVVLDQILGLGDVDELA